MKENKRKCFKCGSSPVNDPETTLFRFPRPGSTNILRCESWEKYCCPDKSWSNKDFQLNLDTENRILCHQHFSETAFVDFPSKKLQRYASPDVEVKTADAAVTADVISRMDKLFDTLNSDMVDLRRGKPFATNLKMSSPHHKYVFFFLF